MDEAPVKLGAMLYTLVDPNPGHEVAYNRWYERDHFYGGCMIGPGILAGARWVATREYKDLRFPADSGVAIPTDAGSYLATYWVQRGHEAEHFGWSSKQVFELYDAGRGFDERTTRTPRCTPTSGPGAATPMACPWSWRSTIDSPGSCRCTSTGPTG